MDKFNAPGAYGALILACALLTDCGNDHFDKNAEMNAIRKTIASIPAWADMIRAGAPENEAFHRCFDEISKYDTQLIRETLLEHIAELEDRKAYTNGEKSRLLVLNRLVFKVPEKIPRAELRYYTGWAGAPQPPWDHLLWPMEIRQGKLCLIVGHPIPVTPQRFDAVAEFDGFADKFPRRRVIGP